MNRVFFLPYKSGSNSCSLLSEYLKIKRIRSENSRYRYKEGDRIINWGSASMIDGVPEKAYINNPKHINPMSNKKTFLEFCKENGVNTPEFTTSIQVVKGWLEEGGSAFARTKLRGMSGEGIVDIQDVSEVVPADLYTKYMPKKEEFRVHVVDGKILFFQRKGLTRGNKNFNSRIRNVANGYIFLKNEDKDLPEPVLKECQKLISVMPLDFYAIDIIYNAYRDTGYVLEVNTAPGLSGTSVESYGEALKGMFNA